MSAPSIPNLLSLRGGPGRGRGRGGPGRGGRGTATPSGSGPGHDLTIQGTDTDAALSRLSAVELGYLDDPFARLLTSGPAPRRLPIINRGTYTRTTAIDHIVNHFLASTPNHQKRQIISLGAGTDTRALRLFSTPHTNITYHEIDFPTIATHKQTLFRSSRDISTLLYFPSSSSPPPSTTPSSPPTTWHFTSRTNTNTLHIHGLDLRTLTPSTPLLPAIDPTLPTLLISECCLCYLPTTSASSVLSHFTSRIPNLGIILYEPVKPDDPFGRVMTSNLAARGIRMPTLEVYKEPRDQEERLREAGFDEVRQMTVDKIWERWVGEEEKERVEGLEMLDEVEEWVLLAGHYIVVWGWRGEGMGLPT